MARCRQTSTSSTEIDAMAFAEAAFWTNFFYVFLIIFSQVSYFHNFRKPLFFSGASASFRHAATRAHTLCFPSAQVHRLGGFRGSDFSMKRFRNIVQWSQWISMIPMISMISMILGFLDSCCWCLSRDLFLSLSLSLSLAFSLFLHCTSYEFFLLNIFVWS